MDFVEIDILCNKELKDILTAELCELGYESFLDTADGFRAYQPVKNHNPDIVSELLGRYSLASSFESRKLTDRNWNEVWERTFEPIEIDQKCRIRASFHEPRKQFNYEIIIDPKMAFGTGHHETTRQVLKNQLEINLESKSVLDIGCGTGILSILAEMMGASKIEALDIDPYAVNNTVENIVLNNCTKIKVHEASIKELKHHNLFDLVVANINRNVLLEEIEAYSEYLSVGGKLILSGFYTYDCDVIVKICKAHRLSVINEAQENHWACLLLEKNQA